MVDALLHEDDRQHEAHLRGDQKLGRLDRPLHLLPNLLTRLGHLGGEHLGELLHPILVWHALAVAVAQGAHAGGSPRSFGPTHAALSRFRPRRDVASAPMRVAFDPTSAVPERRIGAPRAGRASRRRGGDRLDPTAVVTPPRRDRGGRETHRRVHRGLPRHPTLTPDVQILHFS